MGLYITIGEHAGEVGDARLPKHLGSGNELRAARWFTEALVARGALFFRVTEGDRFAVTEEHARGLEAALAAYRRAPGRDVMRGAYCATMAWAIERIRWSIAHEPGAKVRVT